MEGLVGCIEQLEAGRTAVENRYERYVRPDGNRAGETWALIGARVGQRSLSVTADTYTHVLLDDCELDHGRLIAEVGSRA